jgi:hypothetical protein
MAALRPVTGGAIKYAVDIAIAAAPMSSGSWISSPDVVAKLIEAVARKIDELQRETHL